MSHEAVRVTIEESLAVVRLDDGKANALSPRVIEALHARSIVGRRKLARCSSWDGPGASVQAST